jgi:hypothetical protein
MTELVKRLAEVCADDLDVAGGKGANLGELVRAHFPVPGGFVLTTARISRRPRQRASIHAIRRQPRSACRRHPFLESSPQRRLRRMRLWAEAQ